MLVSSHQPLPSLPNKENIGKEQFSLKSGIQLQEKGQSDGLCPYYINGSFPTVKVPTETGGVRELKVTNVTRLDIAMQKKVNLRELIDNGQITCATYKKGILISICVHPKWYDTIMKEKALDLAIYDGEYGIPVEKSYGLVKMTEKSYSNMINTFFIKV